MSTEPDHAHLPNPRIYSNGPEHSIENLIERSQQHADSLVALHAIYNEHAEDHDLASLLVPFVNAAELLARDLQLLADDGKLIAPKDGAQ